MIGQEAGRSRLLAARDVLRAAERSQEERAGRFRRIAGRATNGSAPVAVSSWQLFPTPPDVAACMMDAAGLPGALRPGLRALEPSAGTGNLVRSMLALDVAPDEVTACEVAPEVAREFAADFPGVRLVVGDFLAQSVETLGGRFDLVVMNPPFHRGKDARHILHAAEMLAPGGRLVGLCYDGRAFRETIRPCCESFEVLPCGSFRSSGTSAGVVMVTLSR